MERALRVGAGALSDLPSVRGRAGQDPNSADSVTRTRQREMWRDQLIRLSRTYMGVSFLVKNPLTNISSGANPLRPVHVLWSPCRR